MICINSRGGLENGLGLFCLWQKLVVGLFVGGLLLFKESVVVLAGMGENCMSRDCINYVVGN